MRRLAFLTGPALNSAEKQELRVIGVAMAYIPDCEFITNDVNVQAGIVEGGGGEALPATDNLLDGATAIITYKREPARIRQGADAHISSFPNLKVFSEVAVKSIYARGMEP